MTAGRWMIGDPAVDAGGVSTVSAGHTEWPHKIHKWKFALNRKWQLAPLLTVTGEACDQLSPLDESKELPLNTF